MPSRFGLLVLGASLAGIIASGCFFLGQSCDEHTPCPASAPICDAGFCVECLDETDCPAGRICDAGTCLDCVSDEQCAALGRGVCTAGRCGCVTNDDCDVDQRCSPTGNCEAFLCLDDEDCGIEYCVNAVCVECRSDVDCLDGACINNVCQ